MNRDKIINNIFERIQRKKYISIVDVTNFLIFTDRNFNKNSNRYIINQPNKYYIERFLNENHEDLDKIYIFVCQENFGLLKQLINLENYRNNIIINVACLSALDNFDKNFIQMENIRKSIQNNKEKQCHLDTVLRKNPLDDFVIIVIVQCIYEFFSMRGISSEFCKIYPFNMNHVEILSNDLFRDWNIEKIISGYKKPGALVKKIFNDEFDFLNYSKKILFVENLKASK